jgi:hypothetical protein
LPPLEIDYLRAFFAHGGVVFFGGFSTKLVCKRGVLHGKHRETCGENVVGNCHQIGSKK